MNRFRDTVTIGVPVPADEAMQLFTARGERAWVEGWDPEFPAGEPTEEDGAPSSSQPPTAGPLTGWSLPVRGGALLRADHAGVRRRHGRSPRAQLGLTLDAGRRHL